MAKDKSEKKEKKKARKSEIEAAPEVEMDDTIVKVVEDVDMADGSPVSVELVFPLSLRGVFMFDR